MTGKGRNAEGAEGRGEENAGDTEMSGREGWDL